MTEADDHSKSFVESFIVFLTYEYSLAGDHLKCALKFVWGELVFFDERLLMFITS